MKTIPILYKEMSAIWYAGSRLGMTIFGIKIWGACFPDGHQWFFYFTRIVEHNVTFVVAVLDDLLPRLSLSSTNTLEIWADTGPHFRAYRLLATQAVKYSDKFDISTAVNYGCEKK